MYISFAIFRLLLALDYYKFSRGVFMKSTRDLIREIFDQLQKKHQFNCTLSDEPTHRFMMEFAFESNAIVYDCKMLEQNYEEGSKAGVYRFGLDKFILFCLVHELGHYYDFQENENAFNYSSKEEYIQMELNGIEKAKRIIPVEDFQDFHYFNQLIIQSYKSLEIKTGDD